ncbi:alpha/beta fold hydrolase [Marisediminicola antarctica]|uniref:AB hydrolase-1 domain-containing protein n=1 Tax=Marisediminicola antarctica TaxID=674079 RepID=A0A7L5AHP0_9MICO|nr:alpha/beta hydrolase [Marisediminicola antarctica]QHO68904.1 hypothetical protein BHD05_03875 [Marisediminicola antarctica]
MRTTEFAHSSGRLIGVVEFGDPDAARTVVLSHPAPGSAQFDPDPAVTDAHGIRLIALDRPGYGTSGLHADGSAGTVADAADDIAEYLAAHGIGRVGAVGWSAGGRVALALAARHPQLVDRVAVVATPAPDAEVPWVGEENRAMNAQLAALPPGEATASLRAQFANLVGEYPRGIDIVGMLSADEADAALLEQIRDRLVAMLDRAVLHSVRGIAADIVSYSVRDLDFDERDLRAPTLLVYGLADSVVGAEHGRWHLAKVPHSELELIPGAGHLVIVPRWDRILRHVAPESGA